MANLITLQDYKTYAGISSVEHDAKLSSLIVYTTDFIKKYCGRTFIDNYSEGAFTEIIEYWSGGADSYPTKEFPIQEIVSVEYSSDLGTTYTELVAGTDYALDKEKDLLHVVEGEDNSGINAYKITYKGGYATTPDSLKVAALDLVEYYYKQESTPKRMQNFVSIEYVKSSDLPHHIKRVLDLYRVV